MKSAQKSILAQIRETDFVLFKKVDVSVFLKREAEIPSEEELTSLRQHLRLQRLSWQDQ